MISFIIPAHNEEAWVGRCVSAIQSAVVAVAEPPEIIVVDDASTDATASIARQLGAQVIRVEHRHIAATRNAGARQARGDIFFFVDADTLVNAPTIQSALRALRAGAVGGGCLPRFDGRLPWWCRLGFSAAERRCRRRNVFPSGACVFCTRAAFQAAGGFNENYYAMEDVAFSRALKSLGRFVIPTETVVTSGRKIRAHSWFTFMRLSARWFFLGFRGFRSRKGLEFWYEPEREKEK